MCDGVLSTSQVKAVIKGKKNSLRRHVLTPAIYIMSHARTHTHSHTHTVQGAAVATPAGFGALPRDPYVPQNVLGALCCKDTHRLALGGDDNDQYRYQYQYQSATAEVKFIYYAI